MELSPFEFGTTVGVTAFTNREKDADKLKGNLLNGINTMLISPRRWGKSSLVEKIISDLNSKSPAIKTVSFDLFSVGSEEEFLEMFAREVIRASSTKWEEWLKAGKEFFQQHLVPKLSVGVDPYIDFSITFDWKEIKKYRNEILDLPERIGKKKNVKFVICLDEFQNLTTFNSWSVFEKSMRAVWQRQKFVTYCLYGSKRHMMTDIFTNPSKPFYRFGDIMLLPKIAREKWVSFICESFRKTKKQISEDLAVLIPQYMDDHSWYVQQLAHYTWQNSRKTVTKKDVEKALQELIYANTPLYQRETESLSRGQVNLLKAIAMGEEQLTSVATLEKYKLGTSAGVVKNKGVLMNSDLIDENRGNVVFLDPAYERWFKHFFFGKSIYE